MGLFLSQVRNLGLSESTSFTKQGSGSVAVKETLFWSHWMLAKLLPSSDGDTLRPSGLFTKRTAKWPGKGHTEPKATRVSALGTHRHEHAMENCLQKCPPLGFAPSRLLENVSAYANSLTLWFIRQAKTRAQSPQRVPFSIFNRTGSNGIRSPHITNLTCVPPLSKSPNIQDRP